MRCVLSEQHDPVRPPRGICDCDIRYAIAVEIGDDDLFAGCEGGDPLRREEPPRAGHVLQEHPDRLPINVGHHEVRRPISVNVSDRELPGIDPDDVALARREHPRARLAVDDEPPLAFRHAGFV